MAKKRMTNLELLRCLAMMMVVVLHYLGKGGLLPGLSGADLNGTGVAAWLAETFCIVAVNVYMFISGYFLSTSTFKLSRLLQLWFQVWCYSVVFGVLAALTGAVTEVPVDTHYFLTLMFPVSMGHYWFMTAYIFLYLLTPVLGRAIRAMTKQQLQLTIVSLLVVFSLTKSVLPLRLEMDSQGYDCLWYVCVFMSAAYVRRFGLPRMNKAWKGMLLYVGGCMLIFGGTMALRWVYLSTGSLGRMLNMCMEYNHIFTFLAALGLFMAFLNIKLPEKGIVTSVIEKTAPYTLGVYLLHENIGLRYVWQNWLRADRISGVGELVVWTLIAAVCVFCVGVFTDAMYKLFVKGLGAAFGVLPLGRKWFALLQRADAVFSPSTEQSVPDGDSLYTATGIIEQAETE